MERFQHAMLLFASLGSRITEWEQTLPQEVALAKTEQLLVELSSDEFEMVLDCVALTRTEPGRRLFGPTAMTGIERTLDRVTLRRLPVN